MAILKAKDLRTLTDSDLTKKLYDLRVQLLKERSQSTGTGKNMVRELKRSIARILTELNRRKKEEKQEKIKKRKN